jgi:lysophospholipase L1-like esterase
MKLFFSWTACAVMGVLGIFGNAGMTMAQEGGQDQAMKVVFLGDSITQAGAGPKGYVSLIRDAITARHPNQKIEIIGRGISGNRVPDLQARLKKDVLDLNPNLVVIYIGINDVWHSQSGRGTPKDEYESGLTDIIKQIQGVGSKVILCTPSMIGEKTDGSNTLDAMLEEYSEISRKVALANSVTMLDLRKKFVRELKIRNPDQKERGILTTDGVHLNDDGNVFVKDCMLPGVEAVLLGRSLKHVVMFKFKDTATEADINQVVDEFAALKDKINTIVDLEFGSDISSEGISQGFTHCFIVTFANMADRDAYLPHPAHKDFVKLLGPHLGGVLVVDFWSN